MTLIEILVDYYKLTDDEKYYTLENECPCDYEIFNKYVQGRDNWCNQHLNNCYTCWDSKPIEL